MKKLIIIIICIAGISLSAVAQNRTNFRIGDRDITIIIHNQDSVNKERNPYRYRTIASIAGLGFVVPDNSQYKAMGGSSFNLDAGALRKYNLSRRFAMGGTLHYSFYNYRLRGTNEEPFFNTVLLGDRDIARSDINKQVFRSHNISPGVFSRFYLKPPENHRRDDGFYIDLGLQGDLAFSKYYILKHPNGDKDKFRNNDVFNTLGASAVARIGWKPSWTSGNSNSSAIYFRYRLTNAFNQSVLPMDIPKFTIGINFINTSKPFFN